MHIMSTGSLFSKFICLVLYLIKATSIQVPGSCSSFMNTTMWKTYSYQGLNGRFYKYVTFLHCVFINYEQNYIFTTYISFVCSIVSAAIQSPGPCGLWNKTECDVLPGINKFISFAKHIACLGLI